MSARRRFHSMLAAGSLVLMLVPVALAAPGAGTTSAANWARAKADAPRLLGLLELPSGALRSATEPAGDYGAFEQPGYDELTPNRVDAHAWWTVPGTASDVLAYVAAHVPADANLFARGTSNVAPGYESESFSLPAIAGVLSQRVLAVAVEQLAPGTTAVRTDGEALWISARPAWEQIPAGVRAVTYTARTTTRSGRPGHVSGPIILTGARARELVHFINRLELVQPGERSCPAALDTSIALRLADARGATVARAVERPTGCASVSLKIGNRTGPALNDYPSVTGELDQLGAGRAQRHRR